MSLIHILARKLSDQAVGLPSCCCALPETVIRRMVGAVVHKYRIATGA